MKFFTTLFKLTFLLICLILAAGFFGFIHPALDSLSHFRLHLSVILIVASLFVLIIKDYKLALIGALIGGLCFYLSLEGTILSSQTHKPDETRPTYTLIHFNLLWNNPHKQAVREKITALDPEIITVTETNRSWIDALDKFGKRWPHRYMCYIWKDFGGTKIYSKWPIVKGSEICLEYASYAAVTLTPPDGKPIVVASPHLRWPWPASGPKQLRAMKPTLKTLADDALVAGDFNAVTWSWTLKDFEQTGGLTLYQGIGSTWVSLGNKIPFLFPFGLPIDNVLQKGRVHILSAKTLDNWGSDHLPVLVKFQLK